MLKKKILEILESPRFWIATIVAIGGIIEFYNVLPREVFEILLVWGGTVVGIGTVDSLASRLAGKK